MAAQLRDLPSRCEVGCVWVREEACRQLPSLNLTVARGYLRAVDEIKEVEVSPHGSHQVPQGDLQAHSFLGRAQGQGPQADQLREGIARRVAALGDLILDYGWPVDHVSVEPSNEVGLDLLVFDGPNETDRLVIGGEAKYLRSALKRTISEVEACARGREPVTAVCARKGHKKFRSLYNRRPDYFWAVSGGSRRTFRLKFWKSGDMRMYEKDDIPIAPPN
jgi:hypothetical protein